MKPTNKCLSKGFWPFSNSRQNGAATSKDHFFVVNVAISSDFKPSTLRPFSI